MTRAVQVIDACDSIEEAADRMRSGAIGCLPVLAAGRLAGVVTDRDLVVRCLAHGTASSSVREAMSAHAVTCFADGTLEDAADEMIQSGVRRLVVLDREMEVVGVLSVDDLAVVAEPLAAKVLARTVEQRGELDGMLR